MGKRCKKNSQHYGCSNMDLVGSKSIYCTWTKSTFRGAVYKYRALDIRNDSSVRPKRRDRCEALTPGGGYHGDL